MSEWAVVFAYLIRHARSEPVRLQPVNRAFNVFRTKILTNRPERASRPLAPFRLCDLRRHSDFSPDRRSVTCRRAGNRSHLSIQSAVKQEFGKPHLFKNPRKHSVFRGSRNDYTTITWPKPTEGAAIQLAPYNLSNLLHSSNPRRKHDVASKELT